MGFFYVPTNFHDSKQLQLLAWRIHRFRLTVAKYLHITKLLVGDTQNADVTKLGHKRLHPFDMHLSVLITWAMPEINRELEHSEAIGHDAFTESGIGLTLLLRLGRQIKKHQHPHNSVFAKSVHQTSSIG